MCRHGCCYGQFRRRPELPYRKHSRWIAETINTASSVSFIIGASICTVAFSLKIGQATDACGTGGRTHIEGPIPVNDLSWLICFLFAAGICSAVHHALRDLYGQWTILLDWLPIACSLYIFGRLDVNLIWSRLPAPVGILFGLAFTFLTDDHLSHTLPVPIGHSMWHTVVAAALTWIYLHFTGLLTVVCE